MNTKLKGVIAFLLFICSVASLYFALQTYAEAKIEAKIDRKVKALKLPVFYSDVKYNLWKNQVKIENVALLIGGSPIRIKEVELDLPFEARRKELPKQMLVKVVELHVPSSFALMQSLFPKGLTLNLVGGYTAEDSRIDAFLVTHLERAGKLSVTLKVENFPFRQAQRASKARLLKLIKHAVLKQLTVRFSDEGLLQKALAQQAKESGMSYEAFKNQVVQTVKESFKENPKMEKLIGEPLIAFVKSGGCIELTVSPPGGMDAATLKRILTQKVPLEKLIEELGIKLRNCG